MQQLWLHYKNLSSLYRFLLHSALLFVLFFIFYEFAKNIPIIDKFYERGVNILTNILLYVSQWILSILGQVSYVLPQEQLIYLDQETGIRLLRGCLARNLMALFVGFIIAFPGRIATKLWYIPLGLFMINIINIIRIIALLFIMKSNPKIDANAVHDNFNMIVYFLIFLMWTFWIAKLRLPPNNSITPSPNL